MWQFKILAGCVALSSVLLGADVSPQREVVTPAGLQIVTHSASRRADQVVPGPDGVLNVVFRILKRDERKVAVYYSQRNPAAVWSEPVRLSDEGTDCEEPVIAVCSDGTLVTSWIDATTPDDHALVIRCSADGGKTWASAVRHPSGISRVQPRIAASGRSVYICFTSAAEKRAGDRVFLFQSRDAGSSWIQKEVDFKRAESSSSQVQILAQVDRVWLAWCHQDRTGFAVVVNCSTDRGETWFNEPAVVNDPRPERPSDPLLDFTEKQVVVVWKAVYQGSKAIIYEDRSEDGITWGSDRVLLESKVIPVTYRIVRLGNDRCLVWLGVANLKSGQKAIYWSKITHTSQAPTNQEVISWPEGEQADFSEFAVNIIGERLYLAAIARFGKGDWRLLLLSRKADGEDKSWIVGGGDRKERSSLALVPLGQGVGWLFHERKARILPMESLLGGNLVFGRLE